MSTMGTVVLNDQFHERSEIGCHKKERLFVLYVGDKCILGPSPIAAAISGWFLA